MRTVFGKIDRRSEVPAAKKLDDGIAAAKAAYGRDPRGGGFSFVANFEYARQVAQDLPKAEYRELPSVIVGAVDRDTGATSCSVLLFKGVPLKVRRSAKPDKVHLVPDDLVPPATTEDKVAAGKIRYAIRSLVIGVQS